MRHWSVPRLVSWLWVGCPGPAPTARACVWVWRQRWLQGRALPAPRSASGHPALPARGCFEFRPFFPAHLWPTVLQGPNLQPRAFLRPLFPLSLSLSSLSSGACRCYVWSRPLGPEQAPPLLASGSQSRLTLVPCELAGCSAAALALAGASNCAGSLAKAQLWGQTGGQAWA